MTATPIEKLVFAILLSAVKKNAQLIRLRCDHVSFVVSFELDGRLQEEMRPPVRLQLQIFDRIKQMAGMSEPAKGQTSVGYIQIRIEIASVFFHVTLWNAADGSRISEIRVITADKYPHSN